MSLPPIPCAHCGVNFMRQSIDPEAPKLCNTCVIRDQQRNPKKVVQTMEKTKLLIEVDRKTQVEVEEICINEGISMSDYFMRIHHEARCKSYPTVESFNLPQKSTHSPSEDEAQQSPKRPRGRPKNLS
jgi:hypothetical protein